MAVEPGTRVQPVRPQQFEVRQAEEIITRISVREGVHFAALRRDVRVVLAEAGVGPEIDQAVYELLS